MIPTSITLPHILLNYINTLFKPRNQHLGDMTVISLAKKMLASRYLCDNCLGRQFAQLLTGHSNSERGRAIRLALAMDYETKSFKIKPENLRGFKFRSSASNIGKKSVCAVCENLFESMDKIADRVAKKLPKNTKTFMIGCRVVGLTEKEESLWSKTGVQYCEPIRSEINRELGKLVWKKTGKEPDERSPEVRAIVDLDTNKIETELASLYVSGGYKKLKRGIPQTKWDKYKVTVEDIIANPFMKITKGTAHALHAAGREDIDALCLDWRPFVFEVKNPQKRDIDLKKMTVIINMSSKIKVKGLKFSDRRQVVQVKSMRNDKEYRAIVELESPVTDKDLNKLSQLQTIIKQKTPHRVLHRRADTTRNRKVKNIKWKKINNETIELIIKGEAGLYIKELISGDDGRTTPSASEILNKKAKVKELDVIKIDT